MFKKNNFVIEPSDCSECPLYHFETHAEGEESWCKVDPGTKSVIPLKRGIPSNCPLRSYAVLVRLEE